MSDTPLTIPRAAPEHPGLDYQALLDEGTTLVQSLSGALWTNYNASDPGVLILQQLCYALTELSYRAGFEVADLLGAPGSGVVSLPRQGLYAARDIMPVNPVTIKQFRKLLLDSVPEAGNIWLTPLKPADAGGVNGLYRIDVLARQDDCACDLEPRDDLAARVLDVYTAHRALCEDVLECQVLEPVPTAVRADVHLDCGADADAVLAGLLFAIGMVLSPEPLRTGLAAQLAAGRSTAEIFDGPLPRRGFIADDQLTPLPSSVPVASVLEAMARVVGVLEIEDLLLRVDGRVYGPEDTVAAGAGAILHLAWRARTGVDGIRLFRDGLACRPDPLRVRRMLDGAWDEQRRSYPLEEACHAAFPVPSGSGRDLARYSSVQEQFPAVYGIGSAGLPSSADALRRAQAHQLKAYLMPFDQLMADYFSQLALIRDLFSTSAGGDRTYVWQSLRGLVPDAAPLLVDDYEQQMQVLIASRDPVEARQTAILGLLLSLYASASSLTREEACGLPYSPAEGAERNTALIAAQRALLREMVPATHDRGRGIDYRRREHRQAGLEVRARIELALLNAGQAVPLYVIEWILLRDALRPAEGEDAAPAPLEGAACSFRITAVVPLPDQEDETADGGDTAGWRSQVFRILRENTPAHVVLDQLCLGPERMAQFESLHDDWLQALRAGRAAKRRAASRRLADFLRPQARADHHRAPAPSPAAPVAVPQPAANAPAYLPSAPAARENTAALPSLPGQAGAADAGATGACVGGRLEPGQAQAFARQGMRFVLRELTLGAPGGDFKLAEAGAILDAGMAIMPFQRSPAGAWRPTAQQGRRDGKRAAALARLAGLARGVTIWLRPADAAQAELRGYCDAWREAVIQAGYGAGLIVDEVQAPAGGPPIEGLAFDCYAGCASAAPNGDDGLQLQTVRYQACVIRAGRGGAPRWQAPPHGAVNAPALVNGTR